MRALRRHALARLQLAHTWCSAPAELDAQLEREVTGERIRDKFAASKRKGMWMGGVPPLGYGVENRRLVPNEREAKAKRTLRRCHAH
jgi:hypothetical protein